MGKRFLAIFLIISLCIGTLSMTASAYVEGDPLYSEADGQVDHTYEPDDNYYVDPGVTINDLKTSTKGIDFIKSREGFVNKPYMDVSQMSIGYGCSTVYAEKYGFRTDSITVEEADQLLLYVVGELEQALDHFLETYGIALNQTQYDALISFTFNVGTSWLNPEYRLADLLISKNYSVNELASAMGIWCHVGKEIDNVLILRRIYEIKLFLYGAYELDETSNKFCYMVFDGNGGSPQVDIAFFLEGEPYGPLYTAELEGLYFNGWYTSDGKHITENTIVSDDITVYAKWGNTDTLQEASKAFSDVTEAAWFYTYLNDLYHNGVINGYVDGTFRPNNIVTTGEALKMIILAAGYKEPAPIASHWARNYLNLALEEGIIDRGDITDLDIPISRQLVAKVVANALGISRIYNFEPFSDTSDPYVLALYDYDIVTGYTDGTFGPNRSLTRSELAAIVWRMGQVS